MAASQQARAVHVGLPSQSISARIGQHPRSRVVFYSGGWESASIVLIRNQSHLNLDNSCESLHWARVLVTKYPFDCSCQGLHIYHEWLVLVIQTQAGGTSEALRSPLP